MTVDFARGRLLAALSRKVRSYRFKRMREFMREQRCDALAFTSPDWFEWASNHPVRELAWERPFLLVVTSDERSICVISEQSRNHIAEETRRGTLWIDHVVFCAETPASQASEFTAANWPTLAAGLFEAERLSSARVAVDGVSEPLVRALELIPGLRVVAPREAMRALRWVKHEEEVDTMRAAAALSDWALDVYRKELRPGRLLAEVDFIVSAQLAREAARRCPGEDFSIVSLSTLSGPNSACPKGDGAPNGRVLHDDAAAVTTLATRLNGLAMEVARPWLVGEPPPRAIACYECALAAQQAAIEAAAPGHPVRGIHEAARRVTDREGMGNYLRLRAGHGIGVAMHDFPEDVPFNPRALLAGETYAIEPGLFVEGLGGFRFADVVAVRETGPEQLSKAPKSRAAQSLS